MNILKKALVLPFVVLFLMIMLTACGKTVEDNDISVDPAAAPVESEVTETYEDIVNRYIQTIDEKGPTIVESFKTEGAALNGDPDLLRDLQLKKTQELQDIVDMGCGDLLSLGETLGDVEPDENGRTPVDYELDKIIDASDVYSQQIADACYEFLKG